MSVWELRQAIESRIPAIYLLLPLLIALAVWAGIALADYDSRQEKKKRGQGND